MPLGSALTRLRLKRAGFGVAGGLVAACSLIFLMNPEKFIQKFKY